MQAAKFQFADEARTVCIVAGGPSVTQHDVDRCRGRPAIAVNDAYKLAPWADVLYACDGAWWDYHIKHVRRDFGGECWTQDRQAAETHDLRWVYGTQEAGLSREPAKIHFGSSSGYQAINLAYLWGARRFVLLGFDCQPVKGKKHWFGDHPHPLAKDSPYAKWVQNYKQLAAEMTDCEVMNCSPTSALKFWPYVPLEQCLS